VFGYDSWKYPVDTPAGRSQKAILEVKYPKDRFPAWISELENNYPITHTNYSKYIEGMGFLFQGPLRHHPEARYFLPHIETYLANGERL
jgi:SPX domain protein involved in polyphosphate accumulation